jgi:hypothetical protein
MDIVSKGYVNVNQDTMKKIVLKRPVLIIAQTTATVMRTQNVFVNLAMKGSIAALNHVLINALDAVFVTVQILYQNVSVLPAILVKIVLIRCVLITVQKMENVSKEHVYVMKVLKV